MYREGDLNLISVPCETYDREEEDCTSHEWGAHSMYDSRESHERIVGPAVYLPHSCDYWVIGGIEQIEALVADLQKILAQFREK